MEAREAERPSFQSPRESRPRLRTLGTESPMVKPTPESVKPTPEALEQLRPLVAQRTQEQAAYESAREERFSAEAAFLVQVIALTRPALEGMSYGITLEYERHLEPNPHPPSELTTPFEILGEPVRGFHVEGLRVPKRIPLHTPKGELGGEGLWLCADGRLLELEFSGSYDSARQKDMEWRATATFLSPREALESGWSAEAIFNAVRTALLTMQRGRATAREHKQARKMEAIVHAIAEMLKQDEDSTESSAARRRDRRR